ncbi:MULTISPECIES: hypothetical protein [Actinoalloteichus]|uniref:Uncharacterized protein n=1 Tax=Actinoalloteichus fjordicus TaxID=1612552 RepID=A0AAC9L9R5_9PSEU|nr:MULTISPECIES: hypothetical protein [Actinoalloteichus]APU13436.1 hypothetical protein UA74_06830 [Actinoalloteichus fjordicus]APU19385.1 hypothetical protein UA75_06825 [Actinoalloteichus sp. GBA129-24]
MRKASHQADGVQASSHLVAEYTSDGEDWTITVSNGVETRSAHAAGILAAREATDRLAGELHAGEGSPTIVHLLDGDALAFTSAYLTARHVSPRPDQPRAAEASPENSVAADAGADVAGEEKTADEAPRKKKSTASRRRRGTRTATVSTEDTEQGSATGSAADTSGSDDVERPEADSA